MCAAWLAASINQLGRIFQNLGFLIKLCSYFDNLKKNLLGILLSYYVDFAGRVSTICLYYLTTIYIVSTYLCIYWRKRYFMRTLCSAWSTSRVHWKSYHLFQNYGRLCLLDLPFCVPSIHSSNLAILAKYWSVKSSIIGHLIIITAQHFDKHIGISVKSNFQW